MVINTETENTEAQSIRAVGFLSVQGGDQTDLLQSQGDMFPDIPLAAAPTQAAHGAQPDPGELVGLHGSQV